MWKAIFINNKETNYECNPSGLVRNRKTKRVLRGNTKKNGYIEYELYLADRHIYILGHRLVAQTFLTNPQNYKQINHKDGNKTNNSVDNLEWCDSSYNNAHAYQSGLNDHESLKVSIYQLDKNYRIVQTYASIAEAKRVTGILNINKVLKGERRSAGGFYWKYSDNTYTPKKIGIKKKVAQYTLQGEIIAIYDSASEASRITGIYRKGITDCCNNKISACRGYKWCFYNKR